MIEVERLSADRLSNELWRFSVDAGFLGGEAVFVRLQFYGRSKRETTRHKFQYPPANRFNIHDQRDYTSGIKADDVPLPSDVCAEAIAQVRFKIVDANRQFPHPTGD